MAHWQFVYRKRNAFGPHDYETPGLGGSETALVLLTRELAHRGHQVEVFNAPWSPGVHDGVHWRGVWELDSAATPDVAVAVRFDESLWKTQARQHIFWMLDDRPHGPQAFAKAHPTAPVVLASDTMRGRLAAAGADVPTVKIPLPIETERYRQELPRERACLFSSMPNRGLDTLVGFWPRIRSEVPDAQLWVTSGWQLWGFTNSESDDRWRQVLGTDAVPEGVHLLSRYGSLSKSELIDLQRRAWLGLYPSRFPEMFCYSAAESAAAGTPMITSDLDALSERVDHGRTGLLIPGDITDPAVQDRFVAATVDLLTDRARRDRLAEAARADAASCSLEAVADRWEALLD
ncbi:glycosyltransferase family 4 protein [Nocardiopsis sp. NPDC050513]|uniref:glycosyltransferase family 4 protein n=1 Tax=Nocardiopsis sp. NPDC050513 TaxID=3364338 RepID=UPI0037A0B07E